MMVLMRQIERFLLMFFFSLLHRKIVSARDFTGKQSKQNTSVLDIKQARKRARIFPALYLYQYLHRKVWGFFAVISNLFWSRNVLDWPGKGFSHEKCVLITLKISFNPFLLGQGALSAEEEHATSETPCIA